MWTEQSGPGPFVRQVHFDIIKALHYLFTIICRVSLQKGALGLHETNPVLSEFIKFSSENVLKDDVARFFVN